MISWKSTSRKLLTAGALAAGLGLAGCATYPAGYGGYAWGYGPDYYGYGIDYWPGYYNGLFVAGGGPVFIGRERVVHRGVRIGHRTVRPPAGSFAAAHGGIGKFGMRIGGRPGGAHFGGAHFGASHFAAAHGGIGHFGGRP